MEDEEAVTLQERVTATAGRLSPMEQRVAHYLQANPIRVAASSAVDLARLIGTSDATVVRTAVSLGYASFAKMRKSLAAEGPHHPVTRGDPAAAGALAETLADTLAVIGQLRDERVAAAWSAAADLLERADRVWTVGFGPAATVAESFAMALRRIGAEAAAITTTGFRMADDLARVRTGDVVVVVAPIRFYREIDAVLATAREVGAGTVVISEALGLALRGRADVVVSTPVTTTNTASELTSALLVTHALALHLARHDRDRTLDRLAEIDRLRARVVGGPLDAL